MSAFIKKIYAFLKGLLKSIKKLLLSAFTWIIAFSITGTAAIVYGIYLLAGMGYSLVVLGAFLLLSVALIARGAANG